MKAHQERSQIRRQSDSGSRGRPQSPATIAASWGPEHYSLSVTGRPSGYSILFTVDIVAETCRGPPVREPYTRRRFHDDVDSLRHTLYRRCSSGSRGIVEDERILLSTTSSYVAFLRLREGPAGLLTEAGLREALRNGFPPLVLERY